MNEAISDYVSEAFRRQAALHTPSLYDFIMGRIEAEVLADAYQNAMVDYYKKKYTEISEPAECQHFM